MKPRSHRTGLPSEGHKRALLGSCTRGWVKLPCDLPSRMLCTYKTDEDTAFPVGIENFSILISGDLSSSSRAARVIWEEFASRELPDYAPW